MLNSILIIACSLITIIWISYYLKNQSYYIYLPTGPLKAKKKKDIYNDFLRTLRITTNSRFEASKRLTRTSFMVFFTTTIASLGLILIPLVDLGLNKQIFTDNALTGFQIFLAVCVLVYSSIGSIADYKLRSNNFLECADSIKRIIDDVQLKSKEMKKLDQEIDLKNFQERYRQIISDTENHEDIDYINAVKIYDKRENTNTYIPSMQKISSIFFYCLRTYGCFLCLMALELFFISDMIGITKVFYFFHKA